MTEVEQVASQPWREFLGVERQFPEKVGIVDRGVPIENPADQCLDQTGLIGPEMNLVHVIRLRS